MKKILLLLVLIFALFMSCSKLDITKGTPKCVDTKIAAFNNATVCRDAKVDEYTFQGGTVYVFDQGTCGADMTSAVIDADCNALGNLGGFSGNMNINGENFSNATYVKTVWNK